MSTRRNKIHHKEILKSGKRKTARATAAIRAGTGKIRVNNIPLEVVSPLIAREIMLMPITLTGEFRNLVDIDVDVKGGGFMGQASAVANAISRSIIRWFQDYKPSIARELKTTMLAYDRHLLVGDSRQRESKKSGRLRARRRRQKSYR